MDPISKALVSTNGKTPPKASWFIFFKGSGRGYAFATDSVNLYIAGSVDNTSSFLVKLTFDGILIWQKKLDGAGTESAYGAVTDGSGNIIIGGTTTSAGAGVDDGFSCIYNSSGSLIANTTKVLGGTNSDNFYSGLVLGLNNTYYLAGSTILNTRQAGLIAKYDATSALVWQSTLSSATVSIDTNDITIDTTSNDIYIGGVAQGSKILIAKYNSSGVIQWQRELNIVQGNQINYATGIVIASGTAVYTACRVSSDTINKYDVALVKYNNLGTLQWQKTLRLTASTASVSTAAVATDQTFVYVAVTTEGGALIYKVDSNGVLQWVNKINYLKNASLSMSVEDILYNDNALYITGILQNAPYAAKLPSDGTGAGSYGELGYGPYGSYSWFDSGLTETTPTYTSAAGTLTDAAATLTESNATFLPEVSYAPYKSWIKRYGGSGDVIFGIEVETSDAPFIRVVGGFTNGTNPQGVRDIYYAELNLQGQIITNRRSGEATVTAIGYALTRTEKDDSDFIVVGSIISSAQGATGDIYIQEVDNSVLSSISIRSLVESGHTNVPTDVASLNRVVSTFCISGKKITSGTVSGAKVIYLLSATGVSWQRIIGAGTVTSAEGVALAESGLNVYVSGYTTNGIAGQTATHLFLAKYNSSGVIQWQRSLSTGTTNDVFGSKVAVDSLENVYVTGSVRVGASNTDSDILVVKYDSSGTIQWQRRLGSVGGVNQFGVGIDTDSSNNVYIAGYGPNGISSLDSIILAKYNSIGTLQWHTSISSGIASSNMAVTDLKVHADGYIYVVGRMYTTGNSEDQGTFIARLPQDGTNTGIYGDLEYTTANLINAATTLTSAASTLTDAADSMTMTSPAGFTQADTSITIGPGAGK